MLRSMTGFGAAAVSFPKGKWRVEIQSLNRKFLDVQLSLPPLFQSLDPEVRRAVNHAISRGHVQVRAHFLPTDEGMPPVQLDLPFARQLKKGWEEMAAALELPIDPEEIMETLMQRADLVAIPTAIDNVDEYRAPLEEAVGKALNQLVAFREREGVALARDLEARLSDLSSTVQTIAERAPLVKEHYREKIRHALEEALPGAIDNDERVLRELTLYADRVDISEEIVRFTSHVEECLNQVRLQEAASGKHLEFILQELGREANTMGSKANDYPLSQAVVTIKGELEKIREQLQNVE